MMQDQMTSGAAGQKNKTYALAMTALMAAVTCVLAPMAIPIGPVPISLTNLAIYLSLYLLGWKWGTASYVVYMLIGMVGVPVFSGFTGGLGKLAGPTGGYIIGFVSRREVLADGTAQLTVFVPTSPNPTTGLVFFFPEEEVEYLDMTPEKAFTKIISLGVKS